MVMDYPFGVVTLLMMKRTSLICCGIFLLGRLPTAFAANVTINATNTLSVIAPEAFGIHTSVYDNQNQNASLPGLLKEAGITAMRYSGGGYAEVYHWGVH